MRKISGVTLSVVAASISVLSGCATISGGTSEVVEVNTTPTDAKITIDGQQEFKSPASISLARGKDHMIVIEKDGYKPATISTQREFRGMATVGGNILWLLPGVIVDGLSGAMYEFKDTTLTVALEPQAPPQSQN